MSLWELLFSNNEPSFKGSLTTLYSRWNAPIRKKVRKWSAKLRLRIIMENATNSGNISRATNRTTSWKNPPAMLINWPADIVPLINNPRTRPPSTTRQSSSHESLIFYTCRIINAKKKLARIIEISTGGLTLPGTLYGGLTTPSAVYLRRSPWQLLLCEDR